ncbi:MAG: hypothetical protein QNJ97_24205 [Myxococcota bacterium]|nr:hypothetical protein [Myxococcota bacterium]
MIKYIFNMLFITLLITLLHPAEVGCATSVEDTSTRTNDMPANTLKGAEHQGNAARVAEVKKEESEYHIKIRLVLPFSILRVGARDERWCGLIDGDCFAYHHESAPGFFGAGLNVALERNDLLAGETGFDISGAAYLRWWSFFFRLGVVPHLLDQRTQERGWVLQVGGLVGMRYFNFQEDADIQYYETRAFYGTLTGTLEATHYWTNHFGLCIRFLTLLEVGIANKNREFDGAPFVWHAGADDKITFGWGFDFGLAF